MQAIKHPLTDRALSDSYKIGQRSAERLMPGQAHEVDPKERKAYESKL